MSYQGNPCWYELTTNDVAAAGRFYAEIFGWSIADAGVEGFNYSLAKLQDEMVAGLTTAPPDAGEVPPSWLSYFAVDNVDDSAQRVAQLGGAVLVEPADIPGTGRYAIVADPQGAAFGLLQPDMSGMSDEDRAKAERGEGAFNQRKAGHVNWNELMSSDPEAGFAFYAALFGWTKGQAIEMNDCPEDGEAPGGTYQLFQHKGVDIGAMMPQGNAPQPTWLPYFGVDDPVSAVIEKVKAAGGHIEVGPVEVPGPAYIAVGSDPQGAWFAVVGATK